MVARLWRGWTGADAADEVVAHLRAGALARFAAAPGNVSADVLVRPQAGGVEVLTLTVWSSRGALPDGVEEGHELLVARQTRADVWELSGSQEAVVRAA
jgi:heme-degrading monooxygenase HmoA